MLLIKKGFGASTLLSSPSDGSRGGAMGACLPPPLILRPNWGPKGRNNFFGDCPPYLRVWMTTTPPPSPLHLKVWLRYCHQHYHYHDHPSIDLVTNVHDKPWYSAPIRLFAFIMVISFTFISSMILVKQAVFPVPGAPEMYKLPGFPFGRWLCRNDLISAISFSRHIKLSGCEECSALLTLEYWWPFKIRVSNLLWCQFYFHNIILRMQDSWRSH